MLVAHMAVVDAAHRAVDFGGPPIGAAEPAAMILEPDAGAAETAFGPEFVFDLEGHARTVIGQGIAHHRLIAAGEVVGVEEGGKAAPGREPGRFAAENVEGVVRPDDLVAVDDPVIGGKPRGFQGGAKLVLAGRRQGRRLRQFQHGFAAGQNVETEGRGLMGIVQGASGTQI